MRIVIDIDCGMGSDEEGRETKILDEIEDRLSQCNTFQFEKIESMAEEDYKALEIDQKDVYFEGYHLL